MFWFIGKFKKSKDKRLALSLSRGFSLLELIVVISIFLIITVVVIADIPSFRDKSALDLTVNEVATYVRGAQVYGAAQKNREPFYMINFTKSGQTFCLLSKTKDDCSGSGYEEKYEIPGFKINRIFNGQSEISPDNVYIVFRSNDFLATIGTKLEPIFYSDYQNKVPLGVSSYLAVEIASIRNSANSYCVRIYVNGQITPAQCQDS